jgi:hypothetical protein
MQLSQHNRDALEWVPDITISLSCRWNRNWGWPGSSALCVEAGCDGMPRELGDDNEARFPPARE